MRRRLFVQGAGAIPLGEALPGSTQAGPHAGDAPLAGALGRFNGGRSQVNLSPLQWGGGFPFLNCLKTAQTWALADGSDLPAPDSLDADGYPLSVSHGGVSTVFFVPSQATRPGDYVITWDGNGTILLGMQHVPVRGSKSSNRGKGRFLFSTASTRFVVGIERVGVPHITNMRLFHVDDEAALEEGEVFGSKFKQRLQEANFGVIRFLNWQLGNGTNVTTWASRKPVSYVYYSGDELRSSLYAGVTTNERAAYAATLPGFRLVDKATVIVRFNADCSGPCTLNVNGTGAIRILSEYSGPVSARPYLHILGGTSRSLATLVYDRTLGAWIKFGGDLAFGSSGLVNGCPPELMVRLCAQVGAYPYFVTPAFASDPLTDFMPGLAAYCRAHAPAWMVPRFEGPNELWNAAAGFLQTGYAQAKATAYGWGLDHHNWYGKVMSVLGQAVSAVYGGDRRLYQVVCGVQTASGRTLAGTSASNARLSSARYVTQAAPAQAPYTRTPASHWVTHIACAQYYTPSDYGTTREAELASAYGRSSADPRLQASIANAYAATSDRSDGRYTLPQVRQMYANWKQWALSFRVRNMCGYEGGYSPDLGGTAEVRALRAESKRAACLEGFTLVNYRNFTGLTDGSLTAEFPSCFQLSGKAPTDNAWSVLDDLYQTPDPPQWKGIVAFNREG